MKIKSSDVPNELNQFVPAGLKWLAEMEAVNSPVLLNVLYGNIYSFPNVDDAEILIDRNNKKMLILVRFNWLTRKIFKGRKKETTISILDQLQELLPSFTFRVIEDKALFDLAVKRMTESLLGGQDVTNTKGPDANSGNDSDSSSGNTQNSSATHETPVESESKVIETDKKEPQET